MRTSYLNKTLAASCMLLILFVIYSLFAKTPVNESTIQADAGFLDLSDKNIYTDEAVYLTGEWSFFHNQFSDPLAGETPSDGYITVPGLWNSFQYNETSIGADGYGTYRDPQKSKQLIGELGQARLRGWRFFRNPYFRVQRSSLPFL